MVCQYVLGVLVLYEEMVKLLERLYAAIPFEEVLVVTEDAAHAVNLCSALVQSSEEVCPELILDEYRYLWMSVADEGLDIAWSVEGNVAHQVCSLIVFSYLIS